MDEAGELEGAATEVLTKSPFEGIRVCFGQLVYYRKKGMRYRFVTKVLDYAEFRAKRNTLVVDVPQDELFVEEGPPVFPVANANRRALVEGAAEGELPEIPLKEVPFPPEGSDDKPPPREPKARSVYITVERIIKFKETPGCKACYGKAAIHTPECRKRFTELVEKERKEKEERRSLPPTPGRSVPPTPAETVPPTPAAESVAPPTPAAVPEAPVRGEAEVSSVAGAAVPSVTATSTKLAEATGDQPPVFGVPAGVSPKPAPQQKPVFQKGTNRRARRAKAKGKSLTTVFEYDCSPSSVFGKTNAELGVPHLRLSRKFFDLEDNCVQAQVKEFLSKHTSSWHKVEVSGCNFGWWGKEQQQHREKEQALKHISPLAGLDDFAAVIESDPTSKQIVEESVPVWDESNPREYAEVQKEAKHTGAKVHFGRLMTIVSIKFYELAKHLQKLKGRIVYRGDCAKDEYGAAAVYQELGANPTSVQGLNNCLAYGPEAEHQAFWDELTALVDVEPPEPVFRVLGRNHYIVDVGSEAEDMPSVSASKNAMAFDMVDYAQQTVDLYLSLTGSKKLKNVQTPFCPEGSLPPSDDEVTGELAPAACKLLMKALWLGRLSRPDIIKPIGDLATCVQKWSRNNDRQAHRLICYIDSTKLHRLVGHVDDCPDDLKLSLYVDADFAGEKAHGLPALSLWDTLLGRTMQMTVHEDNQATILIARKGFSAKLRHISRTHKVNLSCLAEQFEEGSGVDVQYIDTNLQAADIFTKQLPPAKWDSAIRLLGLRTKMPKELVDKRVLSSKPGAAPKSSKK
ncbi:unnamed protein product [Symbiodinium microadriaticum]|nr:unnamed protein product [Symbiodinium microadriaticum]